MRRSAGILLPVFSLPSREGIGTLGEGARAFADFLAQSGQSWWQVLPVGPAGAGNSPYSGLSAYAGSPLLIDLAALADDGLLMPEELPGVCPGRAARIDYAAVEAEKMPLLRRAFRRGWERDREAVRAFEEENRGWLPDYALFEALRQRFGLRPWTDWPDAGLRHREPQALERCRRELREEIEFHTYVQYLFHLQWRALKTYANGLGVRLMGDLPIYLALDSADVWAEPENFQLDAEGRPAASAGVPPDAFSAEGQLWGSPLYNWEAMKRDGYGWWIRRVDGAAKLFDALRIDHFRGFESYWAVPAGAASAREGRWVKGPGMDLVGVLTGWFPRLRFVAEDLGLLTPEVGELLRASGIPGMKVLEFAFTGGASNLYLPHNYPSRCVCYTGTHDNAPAAAWRDTLGAEERRAAERYLGVPAGGDLAAALLRAGMSSVAELFMAQMQDWLGLGGDARTNIPGTPLGNWRWRMTQEQLAAAPAEEIRALTALYGRCREA